MGQKITITESQLRDMVVRAINEQLGESEDEGAGWDTFKQMFGGAAQRVGDKIQNTANNISTIYNQNKEANNKVRTAKKDFKTANKANNQLQQQMEKDAQYLDGIKQRYTQFNPGIAKSAGMLSNSIKKAGEASQQNVNNLGNAYQTAQNDRSAMRTQNQNNVRNNGMSGTTQQQQNYSKVGESIEKIVDKVINEMLEK